MTPSLTVSGNGDSATWTFGAEDFIFGEVIGETAIA